MRALAAALLGFAFVLAHAAGPTDVAGGGERDGSLGLEPLAAVQTSANEITLTWQRVPGAQGYRLYAEPHLPGRKAGGPDATLAANVTRYIARAGPAGETHRFSIEAILPGGRVSPRASFDPVTVQANAGPPGAPAGVTAAQTGPGEVTLTWNAVAGATGYAIGRAVGGEGFRSLCSLCPPSARYVDATAVPGQSHTYTVTSIAPGGHSRATQSNALAVSGDASGARTAKAPAPPSEAVAMVLSPEEVRLAWKATGRPDQYRIERAAPEDVARFEVIATVDGAAARYEDRKLPPALQSRIGATLAALAPGSGKTALRGTVEGLAYRIVAVNRQGEASPVRFRQDLSKARASGWPEMPRDAKALVFTPAEVLLSWRTAPGARHYRLERAAPDDASRFETLATLGGTVGSYRDRDLPRELQSKIGSALSRLGSPNGRGFRGGTVQGLRYRIVAINDRGESLAAELAQDLSKAHFDARDFPRAPFDPAAEVLAPNEVRLTWNRQRKPPAGAAMQYRLERSVPGESVRFEPVATVRAGASEYDDRALPQPWQSRINATVAAVHARNDKGGSRTPTRIDGLRYRIVAFNDSYDSEPVEFRMAIDPRARAEPGWPAPPQDAVATVASPSEIHLAWRQARGAEKYRLDRSEDGVHYQALATLTGDTRQYADKALPPAVQSKLRQALESRGHGLAPRPAAAVRYRVVAIGEKGESLPADFSFLAKR